MRENLEGQIRIVAGSRLEIETVLRDLAEGWEHLGNDRQARRVRVALEELRSGSGVVRAGHSEYRVTDP